MKKLVLSSLMLATIASQATGCIITSDDGEDAFVTAEWSFRDVNERGETAIETGCPAGFNTVRMINQEVDADDRPIGSPIVDLFDCVDGRHESAALPPAVYETWLEVLTDGQGSLYAESLSAIVDVRDQDKTFSADIVNNGGYFQFAWDLRDAAGAPLSCAEVADVDGVDGIEILATLTGPQQLVVDQFDCDRAAEVTSALLEGTYQVSVNAFRDTSPNPEDDGAVGDIVNLPNEVIRDRNQVTDLGTVTLVFN